ncbi:MAG TPA: Fic family protein [Terriglobia bacterium]|nr:Fic family protein [Terriglobia bacterium]
MIALEDIEFGEDLREQLQAFAKSVAEFREEGPLDSVSLAKLEEHFRASHVYHSAGIEGNRLTLQETLFVLKEGIDVSGKPLKDSVEVRELGQAFDYLKTLAAKKDTIREADIRSLHSLITKSEKDLSPGEYRNVGVIISGSEHRPPEPLDVPPRMDVLITWINANIDKDPIIVAAIAHHELAAIHPFKDGNGRVSRLLMNLILMKRGYPISNIHREDRPAYYDALSFADVGMYEPLVALIQTSSAGLFAEYVRIRAETKRLAEWAAKWGDKEAQVLRKREARELELWQSRIRQVFLEFQKAAELLDDELGQISISFYDYKNEIDFEKYQNLSERGFIPHANAFSIVFRHQLTGATQRFLFRYFRNFSKFPVPSKIVPLELNHFDQGESRYIRLAELPWAQSIRLRELYFTAAGDFSMRYFNIDTGKEAERTPGTIADAVREFFDDVLHSMFGLRV